MQDAIRSRVLLMVGTSCAYCVVFLLTLVVGLKIQFEETAQVVLLVAFFTIGLSILASRFELIRLGAVVECLGCGFLLTIPIMLSTYLAMRLNYPLADNQLANWDSWLGLDWLRLIRWVDDHGSVAFVSNQAYRTFANQLILCPAILILFNKINRAYQMVAAYGLLCLLASAISVFWPAVGTYSFYQFDASTLKNLDPMYGYFFLGQFHAVRDDPNFIWSLKDSAGIVTFPSVHAGVATLCAWALWPVRLVRFPVLALNVAMALSAVPDANHYAVDVIAGCFVAVVAIFIVKFVTEPRERAVLEPIWFWVRAQPAEKGQLSSE